ncbi:MAG: hypothetical protein WC509_06275, partial [Candidatus Izemoplasmatales bacterium]
MKTSKVFFFGFVFLFLLTATAYRVWLDRQDLIVLGENMPARTEVRVVLSAPEGKRLVPTGAVFAADEVDEVVYAYEVTLPADESLSASVADVELRRDEIASDDAYGLLRFDVSLTRVDPSRATV